MRDLCESAKKGHVCPDDLCRSNPDSTLCGFDQSEYDEITREYFDAEEIDDEETVIALRSHQWTGCQQGGDPADAGSTEWVRYCKVCGMEDTCEDPLPPCPGGSR